MSQVDLVVPDIGAAPDFEVVDVLFKAGDVVEVDTPLVTLETDKASMDVPSTSAGKVAEVLLKRGDKASAGTVIARLDANAAAADKGAPAGANGGAATTGGGGTGAPFDADELERTVTETVLKQATLASGDDGATFSAEAPVPAAAPAALASAPASPPPLAARQ